MKPQKKIIVGNWKMNPATLKEAQALALGIETGLKNIRNVQAIICPPFVYSSSVLPLIKKAARGAQDVFYEAKGSFTGQVSIDMLKNLGVSHVVIGHSEKRKVGETDETVNKKVLLAVKAGITPIICVGEEVRDDEGHYLSTIRSQIEQAVKGLKKTELGKIVIAYEPVWAIGASQAMNAHDVHQMMLYVKKVLMETFKVKGSMITPVIYGGAVDPTNARGLLVDGEADGFIIGRLSLDIKGFVEILSLSAKI